MIRRGWNYCEAHAKSLEPALQAAIQHGNVAIVKPFRYKTLASFRMAVWQGLRWLKDHGRNYPIRIEKGYPGELILRAKDQPCTYHLPGNKL